MARRLRPPAVMVTNRMLPQRPGAVSFTRVLGGNSILTLNKAAGKMASGDMFEGDITL